ncbi:hypothetical protein L1887_54078 [Cichorium endivia]|nr:hypothetical protein L1887_54078 [Cichorium endivia]
MRFFAAILAWTMFLLIVPHYAVYADIDDSTDLFLTFGTDVMTDAFALSVPSVCLGLPVGEPQISSDWRTSLGVHEATSGSRAKLTAWELDKAAFQAALEYVQKKGLRRRKRSAIIFTNLGPTSTSLMGLFQSFKADLPLATLAGRGSSQPDIPLRVFRAKGQRRAQPVVVIITGLDHYHTYMLEKITALTSYGYAVIVVPMPGTADSPITGRDPQAEQEYWDSIVDWIHSHKRLFRTHCVSFWGISTGSYWAVRASRVEAASPALSRQPGHRESLHLYQNGGSKRAEALAYPASLQRALSQAFGYSDPEAFKDEADKFSLLRQGLLDQPSAPLLAVNGERDTIFPIDDQRILAEHGPGARLRWFPHMGHNGEPLSSAWLMEYWKQLSTC